jgi:hypothetical protein
MGEGVGKDCAEGSTSEHRSKFLCAGCDMFCSPYEHLFAFSRPLRSFPVLFHAHPLERYGAVSQRRIYMQEPNPEPKHEKGGELLGVGLK